MIYLRHICVICLSNARNVTQANGRGSFRGFMDLTVASSSGAPNENIVQNHLNIALLNVFSI